SAASATSTQQQWERLQQQLRVEREKEEQESDGMEHPEPRGSFPWLTLIFTVLLYAYAASVGGAVGQFSMLIVIPGFIAAMLRWVPPRAFLLAVLVASGAMILAPEWCIVAPGIHVLVQKQGPLVFAAIALLVYFAALGGAGLENGENHS